MDHFFVYDAVFLICIGVSVLFGVRRGFIKTVISAAVYIVAVLASGFIGDKYAEPVYMEYFHDRIVSVTEDKLVEMRSDIIESIRNIIGVNVFSYENEDENSSGYESDENLFSEYLTNSQIRGKLDIEIKKYILMLADSMKDSLPDMLCSALKDNADDSAAAEFILGNDMSGAAGYIEANILRPPLVRSLRYALWSISFVVISAVGKIITAILYSMKSFEAVRKADSLLGGAAGLAVGTVIVVVLTVALRLVISLTSGGIPALTEESVQRSIIYKYIYDAIKI